MGDFLGGLVGAGAGLIAQNQQTQANIGMQHAAEQWEEHMSDTAVQRGVADEKAAGMNPMLAVMGSGWFSFGSILVQTFAGRVWCLGC